MDQADAQEVKPGTTRVVNLRREPCDVYIGRWKGRSFDGHTQWGNPFVLDRDVDAAGRTACIEAFRRFLAQQLRDDPELRARIVAALRGKRLGCYCAPAECHGCVLARVAEGGEP